MLVSLLFIGSRLWAYRQMVGDQVERPLVLGTVLIFAIVYAFSGLLLAGGWYAILGCRKEWSGRLPWGQAWRIYGRTQIAKYIPGNVFHFAGRHLLGRNAGARHAQLVAAATGEIVMTLIAAGLYTLLAIRVVINRFPFDFIGPALLLFPIGLVAFIFLAWRFNLIRFAQGIRVDRLLAGELSYLIFFAISIALFLGVILLVGGRSFDWALIAGAYAAAWTIGFVVPGAPGGLGVREAMLVTFLTGALEEKIILLAAIIFRLVTTLGDGLFFLAAYKAERGGTNSR
jgi:glycosyltransferase 2 family protein